MNHSYVVQILVPTQTGKGEPVSTEWFDNFLQELTDRFGGATSFVRAPGQGLWRSDGTTERDTIAVLEVMAAKLAAGRALDDDIDRLSGCVAAMREAGEDVEAFAAADLAFHFEVARIAGNTVLQDILHSIRSLLLVWFDRTLRVDGTIAETLVEHQAVFEAIRTRSPVKAERRMKQMMDAADGRLNETLQESGAAQRPHPF